MIKLDGKLLFEQWCIAREVKQPCLFCELADEQTLAWNALADWLCRHQWESVDFAWQKVLKEEAKDFTARMERVKERVEQAEKVEVWKTWLDNTRAEHAALDHSAHHRDCALRHGGIACTC